MKEGDNVNPPCQLHDKPVFLSKFILKYPDLILKLERKEKLTSNTEYHIGHAKF